LERGNEARRKTEEREGGSNPEFLSGFCRMRARALDMTIEKRGKTEAEKRCREAVSPSRLRGGGKRTKTCAEGAGLQKVWRKLGGL